MLLLLQKFQQFFSYLSGVLRGDLGRSYYMQRPVSDVIIEAFPYTLRLTLLAVAFVWTIGIASGVISAMYNKRFPDYLFRGTALMGISVPVFMVALQLAEMLSGAVITEGVRYTVPSEAFI